VLLSGPAGTGKSRACLEVLHFNAEMYPGFRGLICRKTRESITESALVTFEEKVVPLGHPILQEGGQRRTRQSYAYPNGSVIVVGGLDKPSRTLSTEYDQVFVQEAIELTENEWELLTRPLRNGVLPYQQLMGDTNPDSPRHWLKLRCDSGRCTLIPSRHEDNPVYWDSHRNAWTPAGVQYLAKLDALTGPRYYRLRHGRWVQAEGVVYDGWDPAVHLIDRFPIPASWRRVLSIDFGFTNPFCAQLWAIDDDGRMYLYREIYHTRRLVEDHAAHLRQLLAGEPCPEAVVCDTDAEDRATLEKHLGIGTTAAVKDVSPGIQAVAARLRRAGDGKPRLFILRDSLVERDSDLEDRKLPCCTAEEFDGYVWNTAANRKQGEDPLKKDDHGCDALRYAVMHAEQFLGLWDFGPAPKSESLVLRMPREVLGTDRKDEWDEYIDDMPESIWERRMRGDI
jgi:phage terminase large subunit